MLSSTNNSTNNNYYYYYFRKKHSMKRRRPTSWASPSTIIATTALLTAHLCTQTAGIPVFLDLETNNEFNINNNNKIIEDLEDPQELDVESPTNSPTFVILRQTLDLSYDIVLRAERAINMDDLLGSIEADMEDYVFTSLRENLNAEENEGLQVRKVDLDATVLTQRRMMMMLKKRQLRVLQGSIQSQDMTVEVDGSIQYDLDRSSSSNIAPEEAESLLEEELAASLTVEKMAAALSDVDGVLGVYGVSLQIVNDEPVGGDDSNNNNQGTNGGGENNVDDTANVDDNDANALSDNNNENDNGLERPSTLSIVFGFLLTGIAFLGLVAYAYIFYRKRKKRLRRKKQMKESIQYHLPAPKVSPAKRSAPPNKPSGQQIQKPQQQSSTLKVVQQHPENSEDSFTDGSYEGLESESEAPSDAFARELQMAASLDEQAWEDFQRKKDALSRNEVIRATDVGSAFGQYDSPVSSNTKTPPGVSSTEGPASGGNGAGAAVVKSFPYGDEQSVMEEGIEWTDEDNDRGWNPYGGGMNIGGNRSAGSAAKAAEEKKDEWGIDEDEQIFQQPQQPLASESTSALLESIQRDLAKHGTSIDPEPTREDLTSSDVVLEVERLSRYVKRYEQRKERRVKRELDLRRSSNRSSDVSSIPSPPQPYNDNSISSRSTFERSSMPPQGIISRNENHHQHPDSLGTTDRDRALPSRGQNARNEDFSNTGDHDTYRGGNGGGGYYSTSQKENFQMQEQAPTTRTTAPYPTPYDVHSASLPHTRSQESDGRSEDSFDYNYDPDQEGSIRSGQRLGITPFDAQKHEEPSFNYSAMSPMMQKLAKAEALRTSGREDHSLPTDETIGERGRRRRASDGEAYTSRKNTTNTNRLSGLRGSPAMLDYTGNIRRLSDLRDNRAIIDSSQSDVQTDVNVTYWQSPEEAEKKHHHQQQRGVGGIRNHPHHQQQQAPTPPSSTNSTRTPMNGKPSPTRRGSGKFNKLRNLFEERQNEAIFPPDQHWQYGVAKS